MYALMPGLFKGYAKLEQATAKLPRLDNRLRALAELKAAARTHCRLAHRAGPRPRARRSALLARVWHGARGRAGDEVQVVTGREREALRWARGNVENELVAPPRVIEPGVDVERAAVDVAEQHVDVADDHLPVREAHRSAAGTAATGLHEHHRATPGGSEATDRLTRRRGNREPSRSGRAPLSRALRGLIPA